MSVYTILIALFKVSNGRSEVFCVSAHKSLEVDGGDRSSNQRSLPHTAIRVLCSVIR